MPEGPSIVILREEAGVFAGQTIRRAEGNTTIEKERLVGQRIEALRSWGKHFLVEMDDLSLRVHFLLFGSYRINERKLGPPRLSLQFDQGELNFYACSVRFIEEPLDLVYDWPADVMSEHWDAALARKRLRAQPGTLVCDALLDQDLFAGAGNIIKNEVLFRIGVHPLSTVGALPAPRLRALVDQARQYSFDFYAWKKQFVLKKHWLVHTRSLCPRCQVPLARGHLGRSRRRSFFCETCQRLYGDPGGWADAIVRVNPPAGATASSRSPAAPRRRAGTASVPRSAADLPRSRSPPP